MNTDTQPETLPTPDDQNYVSAHQDTLQDKLEKLERLEELAVLKSACLSKFSETIPSVFAKCSIA
jgi:hypothetical protein